MGVELLSEMSSKAAYYAKTKKNRYRREVVKLKSIKNTSCANFVGDWRWAKNESKI